MPGETTFAMPPTAAPREGLALKVVSATDAGRSIAVDGPVLVGTSEVCDLKLSDRTVSRRHLSVCPSGIGVRVRDLESRNGTWLDAARMFDSELPVGSEFRLGNTTIRVERKTGAVDPKVATKEKSVRFGRFIGQAPSLSKLYKRVMLVANTDATVLIEGESGTGKELLAEAIHDHSSRKEKPFVVVDCGVVVASLLESELFGHERGAFTGADRQRIGAFEEAQGGTIFLDEIGELSLPLQTGLLGVLDRRQFRRLGGQRTIELDVRVIAATNRNLDREVEASRFRLDLFHRLAVALIEVPPLRERRGDIELLARHFIGQLRGASEELLTKDVLGRMHSHDWPGNVRELRNHVERLALFGDGLEVDSTDAVEADAHTEGLVEEVVAEGLPYSQARAKALETFTRRYVEVMLEQHGGNVSHAAQAAGVARRHFQRLKQKK